jgi:hypothetical protein
MSYPSVPEKMNEPIEWLRRTAPVVNRILQGRTNNYSSVTLTANSATTTVTLAKGRLSINSVILFMPQTSNAAAGLTGLYVTGIDPDADTFVIHHANNAQTDRTFSYAIIG